MTDQQKSNLISEIVAQMRLAHQRKIDRATPHERNSIAPFDAGDLWLSLAFRTDAQLCDIARHI